MELPSIQIVPAPPGFVIVVELGDTSTESDVVTGEPVIAWRIETRSAKDRDDVVSSCTPLTVDGDAVANCIGVQNPDLTVTVFYEGTFASLAEVRQRYAE